MENVFENDLKCSLCLSKINSGTYWNCGECQSNFHVNCIQNVEKECKKKFKQKSKTQKQSRVTRVSQKLQKTGDIFWKGFIPYHTKQFPELVAHYWKLDSESISIFVKDINNIEKKKHEIQLNSIVKVKQSGIDVEECKASFKYLFLLETNDDIFFCGDGNHNEETLMNTVAKQFFNIFKMVYLPFGGRSKLIVVSN